jgi:hypothetical protein
LCGRDGGKICAGKLNLVAAAGVIALAGSFAVSVGRGGAVNK